MEAMAGVLFVIGLIISMVGGVWLLVKAFQQSVMWGLGSMFVPFVSIIFVISYWDDAKQPFFISLAGTAFFIAAVAFGAGGEMSGMAN